MRAFVVNQLNHPSKIELTRDAPEPKPVPDQVLVDVYSAGLNFYDVSTRLSMCPTWLNEFVIDDAFFPRFCRLKENTRVDLNSRSFWVQSSLVSSRKAHPSLLVARSNRGTEYLVTLRERTRTKSALTPDSFCPSRRT